MPNERFTDLPTTPNATLSDIICAVQGGVSGTSVQETLSQVQQLMLSNTILSFAGNPNGNLAGSTFQLCWDTTDKILYVCTTTGTSSTAVWTQTGLNTLVTPTEGGTGVSNPTAHTIPIAEGSSNFNFLSLVNGQLLIGSTGNDPVPAFLTPGTNISIINTPGGIEISSMNSASFTWNQVTSSQAMISNNGYVTNSGSLVTLTLPITSAFGDELSIVGKGLGGWLIAQGSGQTIHFGTSDTTTGASGSLASINTYDSLSLVCTIANTDWTVVGAPEGNLTVV